MTADPVVDPPVSITIEMVTKAMIKMKNGKAAGSSEIDTKILSASGDTGVPLVTDLANYMIRNGGTIPSDWKNSFLINVYEWKGDAVIGGNYRSLKLLDHVMKGIERGITKERVFIIDMQFGFMPERGTTNTKFILRQLQEKYQAKKRKLHFVFLDLEKAFD